MISLLQRKSLKIFHPILKRVARIYLRKPRNYTFKKITVTVMPGVFHPGLFFSTKILIEFINSMNLENKNVLELGAGSGLISIFCAKKGGLVTASDINTKALDQIALDAEKNSVTIRAQESDLFDQLNPEDFNFIIINPPYYPKDPTNMNDRAWFCGEEFDYFKKLFSQLEKSTLDNTDVYMILSEDCDINTIDLLAKDQGLSLNVIYQKIVSGEKNFIFKMTKV